jgi:hypothetical protein
MTGKEIRDRSRRVVWDAYVTAKTTTDQHYRPYTRRMVKADKIWRDTKQKEKGNTEFIFRTQAANALGGATNSNLFVFGKNTTTSATTQVPKTPGRQEHKQVNQERTDTSGRLLNKGAGRKGRRTKHQWKLRQVELKTAKTKRKPLTTPKEIRKNSNDGVSEITKRWLKQKNTKRQVKGKKHKRKKERTKGKKKKSKRTKEEKQRKEFSSVLKGRGSMGQFKQLTTQPSRFRREASSPAARMAQMKSNK